MSTSPLSNLNANRCFDSMSFSPKSFTSPLVGECLVTLIVIGRPYQKSEILIYDVTHKRRQAFLNPNCIQYLESMFKHSIKYRQFVYSFKKIKYICFMFVTL